MDRFAPGHATGILLYSAGIFFFALNDALGKWLVADYSVGQLLLLRTIGAVFVLAPLLWMHRPALIGGGQTGLKLARVACMAADTFAFYYSTLYLPLADVMTFYMAAPLLITAIAVPFLGEKVGIWRWSAILVGFVGVVIALKPTGAAVSMVSLIALFGSTMYAAGVTITRALKDTHWLQLVTWQFAGAGLTGLVTAPIGWVTPGPVDLLLLFLLGVVAVVCFILIVRALSNTPASVLAPFQYSSILWAAVMGWLVWGDVPTREIVIGNAIIVASGLFLFYRERRRGSDVADRIEPIP
ncbi:DMT family transporter [Prosthecomicrobium hirschii]|uniref:DMT family transporter n=1 Tax=Prosthecodimorpha hirschii TaxID=665126 RepID=UPI0022207679|nr:DMT family transporter [Prosthecomicrobium hirschii]MCW1844095.1 DMT family transporter [Prosthecomicrobium hirschii]